MKKSILVLIFNDKIYYYYKKKNILKIIDAPYIINGVVVNDYKIFKKIIEDAILKSTNIWEIIKPTLIILFPYNYKNQQYISRIISLQLVKEVIVLKAHDFFRGYLLKNNAILVYNLTSIDYIIRKNRQVLYYAISNSLNYHNAIAESLATKEKLFIFNDYNKETNNIPPSYYFSNINDYVIEKLKFYKI